MNLKKLHFFTCLIIFFIGTASLDAQVWFSSYDRAQSLSTGTIEATGGYSHQIFTYDGESEGIFNSFGLRTGYGITKDFDVKISWSTLRFVEESSGDYGLNFFTLTPKYSFAKNRFAAALPFTVFVASADGESESETYLTPQLMFNYPLNQMIEIGINAGYIIPFEEDTEGLLSVGIGVGISPNRDQWIARPEFSILADPGEESMFLSPGVSFSYFFNTRAGSGDE